MDPVRKTERAQLGSWEENKERSVTKSERRVYFMKKEVNSIQCSTQFEKFKV